MTHTIPMIATLVLLVACGGGKDTDTDASSGTTVSLSGQVTGVLNSNGLDGASVCIEGSDTCVTTNANGYYDLELPADSDVTVMFSNANAPTLYTPFHTTTEDLNWEVMGVMSWDEADLQASMIDETLDHSLSLLTFALIDTQRSGADISGVKVTLSPSGGVGPVMLDTDGLPTTELTKTGNGWGGWINMDAGEYTLSFSYQGISCTPYFAHSDATDTSVPVTLQGGAVTYVQLDCEL